MKKILSITLVLAMLLSLPITVFAADGGATTTAAKTPTDIVLRKDADGNSLGAIANGDQFLQYDPNNMNGADTMFTCDGTYVMPRAGMISPYTGKAPAWLVLQYRNAMKGDYELSYQMKLGKSNSGTFFNLFYWQDFDETTGKSFQHYARGAGMGLLVSITNGKVSLNLRQYTASGNAALASNVTGETSAQLLKALNLTPAEGEAAEEGYGLLNFTLRWQNKKLTVVVTNANDSTMTNQVVFDVSESEAAQKAIDAVKVPAGFGIDMSPGATEDERPGFGKFVITDLTETDPTPVELTLKEGMRNNGNLFYQYDALASSGLDTVFTCDGEWFTTKPSMINMATGAASTNAFLQYRYAMKGDYDLSYQLKLSESNLDEVFTYFYWQDYVESGRGYQSSQRGTGFALRLQTLADGYVLLTLIRYDANGGYKKLTESNQFKILDGAAAHAVLNVKLEWKNPTVKVTVTNAADTSKTTGAVTFDASVDQAALNAVKEPAGFGILLTAGEDAAKCTSVGHFSYIDYTSDAPVVDPDYSFVAVDNAFANLPEGDKFARGEDGWFTRGTGAVAPNNAAIIYKHNTSYNYKLSFKVRLNEDNRGRFGIWNIWDGKFSGSHYGYMFNLTALEGGALEYRLARYDGGYKSGNDLITPETEANSKNVKLLEGQAANAELLVTVTVQDRTLSVDVCLANDQTKKAGTVTYDFSAGTERTINRVADRTLGFAILDMAGQEGLKSAAYGEITYTALPGEKPSDEDTDQNDYDKILSDNSYAWNGGIDVTEENFMRYTYDGLTDFEQFLIENGWLTRKNEGNITNNEDKNVRGNAYANAQYKGVMDGGDYKLTFKVKADANNHFRFSVLTRWEDVDGNSSVMFKNQVGYRIYFETTEDNKLQIFCYRTGGAGRLAPLPATAANAAALSLDGIDAGTLEVEVTLVMKGDLIVAEAHLAGDANKSTGPVAFDMSDDVNLMGKIDRTQGFALIDSANESAFMPASFGEFKLYAASKPKTGGDSGEIIDPDDNITTEDPNKDTAKPGDDTKAPGADTTGSTEKPADNDAKGCKSGISVVPFAAVLVLSAAAVTIGRKRKED